MLCYPSMQRMIKSSLLVPKTSDKEAKHSFPATTSLSKASEGTNSEVYLATDVYFESAGSYTSSYYDAKYVYYVEVPTDIYSSEVSMAS